MVDKAYSDNINIQGRLCSLLPETQQKKGV